MLVCVADTGYAVCHVYSWLLGLLAHRVWRCCCLAVDAAAASGCRAHTAVDAAAAGQAVQAAGGH